MRILGLTLIFAYGLLRMKPWAFLLLIGITVFFVSPVKAERMDFDCEDHMRDDLAAMACNIYWEGRNQGEEGMIAIAAVTMWRVRHRDYPDTVADVVWDKNWSRKSGRMVAMFSWTLDGLKDHPFKNEQAEWDAAWLIARNFAISMEQKDRMCPHINQTLEIWSMIEERGAVVYRHPIECEAFDQFHDSKFFMMELIDPTGGAIMFHADYVNPWWNESYFLTKQIGDHLFYSENAPESPE